MKSELIALIKENKIISQEVCYTPVYDSYNCFDGDNEKLLEMLQDNNTIVVKDGHYTISNPKDVRKVYDEYGHVIKEVQAKLYTANLI